MEDFIYLFEKNKPMTDHNGVLREYIDSVKGVSASFGPNCDQMVSHGEFAVAMQREVLATAAYIALLREQGWNVPGGLEERNNWQAKIYFPHGRGTTS
jgi:hypothetical protein